MNQAGGTTLRRGALLGGCLLALMGCTGPPPEAGPGFGTVGQPVEVGGAMLTVNSAEETDLIGESSKPGEGNAFLLVEVKIENKGQYKLPYQRYHFTVTDGAGTTHSAVAVPGQSRPLLSADLEPGKDVTGTIAFRVPADGGGLLLVYQVPGTTRRIEVDLGTYSANSRTTGA